MEFLSQLVDKVRPLTGEKVCINDLVRMMMESHGSYEYDARKAVCIW